MRGIELLCSFFVVSRQPFFSPLSDSPSSHYRRRGQLHSVAGISGGQRGSAHHPHQCFRHQPTVSFATHPRPSIELCPFCFLSISLSRHTDEGCLT